MATVPAKLIGPDEQGRVQVFWETLTDGDDGAPVQISQYPDKTVHSDGSYSGSASITMQGSNNGVAWYTLRDQTGAAISLTADTVGSVIASNPRYMRPLVVSGDGSTDIDVWVETYIPRG